MEIISKELKEITKKLALVLNTCSDANILNIKTSANNDALFFSVSTGEIYTTVRLNVTLLEAFNATVDTKTFIDMVSGLAGDTIKLEIDDAILKLSSGKSKYKLAMIYKDGDLAEPQQITVDNPELTTVIPLDLLKSIDTVNSQEFNRKQDSKVKNIANKLYHISDAGCLTAADNFGACLNLFKLDTPVDILATKQLVKLFGLFTSDPTLTYERRQINNIEQAIIKLTSDNIRLCAYTPADPKVRAVMTSMVTKIRQLATSIYQANLVINAKELSAALGRLAIAAKHTSKVLGTVDQVKLAVVDHHITLTDTSGNSEEVELDPASSIVGDFHTSFYISSAKPIIDMCKSSLITIRSSLNKPILFDFDTVKYMLAPLID